MELVVFPRYEDIYDDNVPKLIDLISGIPTCIIVGFACHTNSIKHVDQFDYKNDLEIFRLLIGRLGEEKFNSIDAKLKDFCTKIFETNNAQTFTIFPITHMLQLIELALQNFEEGDFAQITPEQEENLLKAVLTINTQIDIKSTPKTKANNFLEQFNTITWPSLLPALEHTYKKEIIIPIHQSILLFNFLEKDDFFKPFLDSYLNLVGLEKAIDYVKSLMLLYMSSFNKEIGNYYSHLNEETIKNLPVLNQYIYGVDKSSAEEFKKKRKLYRLLRKKPIFKINNQYYISNWNFIIDKIYEGFKYDFFENSGIKNKLDGKDDSEKWNSFTTLLNQRFSEKVIFRDVIDRYFSNEGRVNLYEDNNKKGWNQDLYHRIRNHISFVEFKGSVLPINDEYTAIKQNIDKNMLIGESGANKAVYQLLEQIEKFHQNINKFEDLGSLGYRRERVLIYPIIVYSNFNWRLPGIHDYLAKIFKEEVKKRNWDFFMIEELAFMYLDFFYDFEGSFIKEKINLHEIVHRSFLLKDSYRERAKRPTSYQDLVLSVRDFEFYSSQVLKTGYTPMNKMSILDEILIKFDLPKI